jgi:AcrR family transcriptional regulator
MLSATPDLGWSWMEVKVVEHREAIIESATALFHEAGFTRATADQIAAGAGITKRTLYRYMRSKEEILLAIHEQFLQTLLQPVDLHGTPRERFTALVRNYVDTVTRDHDEIRVFFEERKHLSEGSLQRVIDMRDEHEASFRETLREGIRADEFREVDVRLATNVVLGTVAGLYEWYRADNGALPPQTLADVLVSLVMDGISDAANALPARARAFEVRSDSSSQSAQIAQRRQRDEPWDSNPIMSNILDRAADLIYRDGYDRMGTRELADAAGVTKSALYYYIPNKEAVLFQINRRLLVRSIEAAAAIAESDQAPVESLRSLIDWHVLSIANNRGALRALSYELRFLDPKHFKEIHVLRRAYARHFCDVVSSAAGGVRCDLLGVLMMGSLNFMGEWYTPGGRLSPEQISSGFSDIFLGGLDSTP